MTFRTPFILVFIPIVLTFIFFMIRRQKPLGFHFPSHTLLTSLSPTWKIYAQQILFVLRMIILALFLISLAGPRSVIEETIHESEGIDIVLTIDASGSMAAEDFTIGKKRFNRLAIVKKVVQEFIEQRTNDRIGLVAFAGLAYTVCPLTTDYSWLSTNLERVELKLIADGTAVGSAIASSLSRLKKSDAESKVIILLTDGMNNAGRMDPVEAARAAQAFGVKIYTIGAGSKGAVPFPAKDFYGRAFYQKVKIDLDEDMLQEVAQVTGGQYFRATDTESLRKIYKEIDALEKTEIEEYGYFEYTELFYKFLLWALFFLAVEIILNNTVLRRIP
ncbi:Aerotolerance protein BatA [hydrothermal vent metagenome]|uniref:Aerotolerance protein BatA n=1 Tax=hydrothermal vent metagenome TaxID=652676 RepID=A0A3B1D333_9ZZZZ